MLASYSMEQHILGGIGNCPILALHEQQWVDQHQLLVKSLCGEEIAGELIRVLSTQYGVGSNQLIASIRNHASLKWLPCKH